MIYIKYSWKDAPSDWAIYKHQKGDTKEFLVLTSNEGRYLPISDFDLKNTKEYWNITYLTEEEVDLIKLELL